MPKAIVLPSARNRLVPSRAAKVRRSSHELARSVAAMLILGLVPPVLALFVFFSAVFWGFSIGGASPELEAVHRMEDTLNLVGAGVVAVAWAVAAFDLRGLRRARLLTCLVLTLACVIGGLAGTFGLRHSPADLDPHGGHRKGEIRDGRIHWQPMAIGAGMCAVAVVLGPNRRNVAGRPTNL